MGHSELGVFSLGTVDITVRIKARARIGVAGWLGLTRFSQLLVWYPEKMHRRKKTGANEKGDSPVWSLAQVILCCGAVLRTVGCLQHPGLCPLDVRRTPHSHLWF